MRSSAIRRGVLQALAPPLSLYPHLGVVSVPTEAAAASRNPSSSVSTFPRGTFDLPWSALQHRGAKILGSDVRRGNIIQRKGRVFQVLEAQHTQQGRGGATIQVELRDVDGGNKISERLRTDESVERVLVEDKTFSFLYQDGDLIFIMDPDTFEQMEISTDLLGKASIYLKEGVTVTIHLYDGKPMSASIPRRVTCTVIEAQPYTKGQSVSPQYKRILLDNGVAVSAPSYIKVGEKVIVDTTNDSYVARDRE